MKNHYKLLSPEMAQARAWGRKTVIRQKITKIVHTIGDTITWLTTWSVDAEYDDLKPTELPIFLSHPDIWSYHKGIPKPDNHGKLRPGRFMPKWMRIYMPKDTITDIRVERVQKITPAHALLEGIRKVTKDGIVKKYCVYDVPPFDMSSTPWQHMPRDPVEAYAQFWDTINPKAPYRWDDNPRVLVIGWEK